jgi:hypothetical protein
MKTFLRNNGLSVVLLLLFAVFLLGQSWAGWIDYNHERRDHGEPGIGYATYLGSPEFFEAMFENWESEFLQMGLFVLLTAVLYQKGSAESHEIPAKKPRSAEGKRRRSWRRRLYEHSLSLTLFFLFAVSFAGHAVSGCGAYNREQRRFGDAPIDVIEYMGTSRFWFESLQNWQSEFLSIGAIVILSIFLREEGSSQSKEVDAPHSQTGT